jgi:hypothetical protein
VLYCLSLYVLHCGAVWRSDRVTRLLYMVHWTGGPVWQHMFIMGLAWSDTVSWAKTCGDFACACVFSMPWGGRTHDVH